MHGEPIHLTSVHFWLAYPITHPYIKPFLIHPLSTAEEGLTGGEGKCQVITSIIVVNEFYACIFRYKYMIHCYLLKRDI